MDRTLALAEEYARGRQLERGLRRRMRELACYVKRDLEADDQRTCYEQDLPVDARCDNCQLQDPVFQALKAQTTADRALLRRLEAAALRLQLPDVVPDGPAEPKRLLELMMDVSV